MKILIIHRSFALVGGAERVIIDKSNYLASQGHDIFLISYEQGNHSVPYSFNSSVQMEDLNCRFFTLSKIPIFKRMFHFIRLKRRLKNSLKDKIAIFHPQVIVLASDWQFLIKDVLDVSNSIPVIAEFHNAYDFITKKIGNNGNGLLVRLTRLYYKNSLKYFIRCYCLVALTENDARHWRKHSNNVIVIPNPVTLYPNVIDDFPKEKGRIICVGRLNAQKRIDRLIVAFKTIAKRYPEWHVDVYGEGDMKASLQQQIVDNHLEGRFVLNEPIKTIYDEYKKSQFLVLSSEYEGRPLVLIEAMACGIPCVSFDCPSGPKEIIEDGKTGLLAENGNIDDLAEKMEWMITHEKERRIMGDNARKAAAIYKPSLIMKKWENVYTGVLNSK